MYIYPKELENGGPKLEGWKKCRTGNCRTGKCGTGKCGNLENAGTKCRPENAMLICCLQSTDTAFKLLQISSVYCCYILLYISQ